MSGLKLTGDGTDAMDMNGTARYGIGHAGTPGAFAWIRLTPADAQTLRDAFTQEARREGRYVLTEQQQRDALASLEKLRLKLEAKRSDRAVLRRNRDK